MQRASQKKRSVDVASLRSMEEGEAKSHGGKARRSGFSFLTKLLLALAICGVLCYFLFTAKKEDDAQGGEGVGGKSTGFFDAISSITTHKSQNHALHGDNNSNSDGDVPSSSSPSPLVRTSTTKTESSDTGGTGGGVTLTDHSVVSRIGSFDAHSLRNAISRSIHKAENYLYEFAKENQERPLPTPVAIGHNDGVSSEKRFAYIAQKGITVMIVSSDEAFAHKVGLALEEWILSKHRLNVYRLEHSLLSQGINSDLGSSPSTINEKTRRAGELCAVLTDAGTVVLANLNIPKQAARDWIRRSHNVRGLPFLEVQVDLGPVPSSSSPSSSSSLGTIGNTGSGEIEPYESPTHPEISIMLTAKDDKAAEQAAIQIGKALLSRGVSVGYNVPSWYPLQSPPDGGFNWKTPQFSTYSRAAAAKFPKVLLTNVDVNWVQCIGEGWASPLTGFMREGALLQTLHFNSLLLDPSDLTGNKNALTTQTNFDDYSTELQMGLRVNMPIPIVLPINDNTKDAIVKSKEKKIALVAPTGKVIAVLTDPEIYEFRKDEMIARVFGGWDKNHPYMQKWVHAGNWLLGGEIELLERIRYDDGLDKYRLTPEELRGKFKQRNADAVYAFQTRNPTHAGHAHLMQEAGNRLKKQGFRKPTLWLSPLGGWSKADDVPLDVRIKQHVQVIEKGMLPASTVLAIWPSPMMYAGPTEVQWHAKSRRNAGATFFITGRDPAGIKRSKSAGGGDFYKGEHGRYVLQTSPGMGDMQILSFGKVYYDTKDMKMKKRDSSRKKDFLSISGSKMRAMARKGVKECVGGIPDDWEDTLSCVPSGFMVEEGWNIMIAYYQNPNLPKWVPFSRMLGAPKLAAATSNIEESGTFGKLDWMLHFNDRSGNKISPWHDIPLNLKEERRGSSGGGGSEEDGGTIISCNMLVEIPMGRTDKLEMQKKIAFNPIAHDQKHNLPRNYLYGIPFFNYGFLPQTWEADDLQDDKGRFGDGDPLDVLEIGGHVLGTGAVVAVKIIGMISVIDQGELDYKLVAIDKTAPDAENIHDANSLEKHRPGLIAKLMDWLINYKIPEGKKRNELEKKQLEPPSKAADVIKQTHGYWNDLSNGKAYGEGFKLSGGIESVPPPETSKKKKTKTEINEDGDVGAKGMEEEGKAEGGSSAKGDRAGDRAGESAHKTTTVTENKVTTNSKLSSSSSSNDNFEHTDDVSSEKQETDDATLGIEGGIAQKVTLSAAAAPAAVEASSTGTSLSAKDVSKNMENFQKKAHNGDASATTTSSSSTDTSPSSSSSSASDQGDGDNIEVSAQKGEKIAAAASDLTERRGGRGGATNDYDKERISRGRTKSRMSMIAEDDKEEDNKGAESELASTTKTNDASKIKERETPDENNGKEESAPALNLDDDAAVLGALSAIEKELVDLENDSIN